MKSFTAFIIISISIALSAFYTWPQWQTVSTLQDKNTQLQDALEKANRLSKLRNDLKTQYDAIPTEEIEKVGKVVPVQYDPIKLTADIQSVALKHAMVIQDVTFTNRTDISNSGMGGAVTEAPPATPYKVVALNLSTKGQYKNFVAFLADLEKNLQILDVTKVDITAQSTQERGGVGVLDFKITLDSYWMN